jgi:hypothetical protein
VYADTWTVINVFTGSAIVISGVVMDGLLAKRADKLVELNHDDFKPGL